MKKLTDADKKRRKRKIMLIVIFSVILIIGLAISWVELSIKDAYLCKLHGTEYSFFNLFRILGK